MIQQFLQNKLLEEQLLEEYIAMRKYQIIEEGFFKDLNKNFMKMFNIFNIFTTGGGKDDKYKQTIKKLREKEEADRKKREKTIKDQLEVRLIAEKETLYNLNKKKLDAENEKEVASIKQGIKKLKSMSSTYTQDDIGKFTANQMKDLCSTIILTGKELTDEDKKLTDIDNMRLRVLEMTGKRGDDGKLKEPYEYLDNVPINENERYKFFEENYKTGLKIKLKEKNSTMSEDDLNKLVDNTFNEENKKYNKFSEDTTAKEYIDNMSSFKNVEKEKIEHEIIKDSLNNINKIDNVGDSKAIEEHNKAVKNKKVADCFDAEGTLDDGKYNALSDDEKKLADTTKTKLSNKTDEKKKAKQLKILNKQKEYEIEESTKESIKRVMEEQNKKYNDVEALLKNTYGDENYENNEICKAFEAQKKAFEELDEKNENDNSSFDDSELLSAKENLQAKINSQSKNIDDKLEVEKTKIDEFNDEVSKVRSKQQSQNIPSKEDIEKATSGIVIDEKDFDIMNNLKDDDNSPAKDLKNAYDALEKEKENIHQKAEDGDIDDEDVKEKIANIDNQQRAIKSYIVKNKLVKDVSKNIELKGSDDKTIEGNLQVKGSSDDKKTFYIKDKEGNDIELNNEKQKEALKQYKINSELSKNIDVEKQRLSKAKDEQDVIKDKNDNIYIKTTDEKGKTIYSKINKDHKTSMTDEDEYDIAAENDSFDNIGEDEDEYEDGDDNYDDEDNEENKEKNTSSEDNSTNTSNPEETSKAKSKVEPSKLWKQRPRKDKPGKSKRYYNEDGTQSISQKEFKEKEKKYKKWSEKHKSTNTNTAKESLLINFIKSEILNESNIPQKYTSLSLYLNTEILKESSEFDKDSDDKDIDEKTKDKKDEKAKDKKEKKDIQKIEGTNSYITNDIAITTIKKTDVNIDLYNYLKKISHKMQNVLMYDMKNQNLIPLNNLKTMFIDDIYKLFGKYLDKKIYNEFYFIHDEKVIYIFIGKNIDIEVLEKIEKYIKTQTDKNIKNSEQLLTGTFENFNNFNILKNFIQNL